MRRMLAFVSVAAAHADATPHFHGVSPFGLAVVAAWLLAGLAFFRYARA
jgi:hypothetical protein